MQFSQHIRVVFRKHRSITYQLIKLKTIISEGFIRRQHTVGYFTGCIFLGSEGRVLGMLDGWRFVCMAGNVVVWVEMLYPTTVVVWFQSLHGDLWYMDVDSSWLKMNLSIRWLNLSGVSSKCSTTSRSMASFASSSARSLSWRFTRLGSQWSFTWIPLYLRGDAVLIAQSSQHIHSSISIVVYFFKGINYICNTPIPPVLKCSVYTTARCQARFNACRTNYIIKM